MLEGSAPSHLPKHPRSHSASNPRRWGHHYHGMVVALDIDTSHLLGTWITRAPKGVIWAPAGLSEADGSLYFFTGNTEDARDWEDGEGVFRVGPDLVHPINSREFFAPSNPAALLSPPRLPIRLATRCWSPTRRAGPHARMAHMCPASALSQLIFINHSWCEVEKPSHRVCGCRQHRQH